MSSPHHQAITTITRQQLIIGIGLVAAVILFTLAAGWMRAAIVLVACLSTLYFADMLFNLFLVISSLRRSTALQIPAEALQTARVWPTYTIFCPLYKEIAVLPQFVRAMQRLDYPTDKLHIMLLLEEDDTETVAAAKAMHLGPEFDIIVVPHSQPKTKPKATNYGLELSHSTYAVIFDAEDEPEPDQLKKAVLAFEEAPTDIACLQAKLNFYNPRQNLLTRLFTAEYSLWFDLVLVGLQNIKGPIPLGGTSNHFKSDVLKGLDGWDPYNVTEDCDLGIRLYAQGFRTGVLDSVTYEEANSKFRNWLRQRSRWFKGYMQTFLVHSRRPRTIQKHPLDLHILTFYLVVGGKVLAALVNPFMWLLTLIYIIFRPLVGVSIDRLYPGPVFYIAVMTLIFGNILYAYYFMLGSAYRQQWELVKLVLLVPGYWLMMSLSAIYALYQLIVKPHYWEKTVHGLHLAEAPHE